MERIVTWWVDEGGKGWKGGSSLGEENEDDMDVDSQDDRKIKFISPEAWHDCLSAAINHTVVTQTSLTPSTLTSTYSFLNSLLAPMNSSNTLPAQLLALDGKEVRNIPSHPLLTGDCCSI